MRICPASPIVFLCTLRSPSCVGCSTLAINKTPRSSNTNAVQRGSRCFYCKLPRSAQTNAQSPLTSTKVLLSAFMEVIPRDTRISDNVGKCCPSRSFPILQNARQQHPQGVRNGGVARAFGKHVNHHRTEAKHYCCCCFGKENVEVGGCLKVKYLAACVS